MREGKIRGEKGRKRDDPGTGRAAGDKDEGERKREWNTTSTIATRKFDFQIGVARANGLRGRGRRVGSAV